jgi:branched-chain amino acid transport system substrate-binding protein
MNTYLKLILLITMFISSVSAEEIIKIVSSLPRTGSANAQTTTIVNGIKMALDEVKSKIGKFKIVYEDWDDASPERGAWDPAVEATNADKAINDPDIMVYIGTYNSGAAKISMPKLNKANLAMISPGNSWPGLTKAGFGENGEPIIYRPNGKITYFRVFPTDDIQAPAAAKWSKELGANKVFIIHDRELYGKGLADLYKKAAEKIGLKVVGFEGIDPKASNYRSLGIKIRQMGSDLVYFGGTTQTNGGQIAKDLRSSGAKVKLMLPDACFENAFIKSAGAENVNDNTYITFPGVPPNELSNEGAKFYQRYIKKYKSEPEAFAIYGYESAKVALASIFKAGEKNREKIVEALRNIKDFEGALGKWSFDLNGDISVRKLSGNTIKNGKFEFIKLLDELDV